MRYATRAALVLADYLRAVGLHSEANWALMKAHFQVQCVTREAAAGAACCSRCDGPATAPLVGPGAACWCWCPSSPPPACSNLCSLPPPLPPNQEENLRAGLLLEQAAHCLLSLSPPHTRKFAFHLVLAGLRYDMCAQKGLAQRAYR